MLAKLAPYAVAVYGLLCVRFTVGELKIFQIWLYFMDLMKEKEAATTYDIPREAEHTPTTDNAPTEGAVDGAYRTIGWKTPPPRPRAPLGPRRRRRPRTVQRAQLVLNNLAVGTSVVHSILYRFQPTMARIVQWNDCWARARCGLRRVLEALPWERGSKRRGRGAPTTRNEVGGRRAGAPQHAQKAAKTFFFLSLYRAQSVPSSSS